MGCRNWTQKTPVGQNGFRKENPILPLSRQILNCFNHIYGTFIRTHKLRIEQSFGFGSITKKKLVLKTSVDINSLKIVKQAERENLLKILSPRECLSVSDFLLGSRPLLSPSKIPLYLRLTQPLVILFGAEGIVVNFFHLDIVDFLIIIKICL